MAKKDKEKKDDSKKKAIDLAKALIIKSQGKEAITSFNEDTEIEPVKGLSTGVQEIDDATGIGGIPKGRLTELFGDYATGKTTIALHAIAETQKNGGCCAFIDVEHALDFKYAKDLGVSFAEEDMVFSQPDSGEKAIEQVDLLAKTGYVDLIVIDSVDALLPQAIIEKGYDESTMGELARLMGKAVRKLVPVCAHSGTAIVFINQIRSKMNTFGHGDTTTTSGGRGLDFYSSMRLSIKNMGGIKQGETKVGNKIKVIVVKNKLGIPFREANCEVEFGKGISPVRGLANAAIEKGIIEKKGSWYSYEEHSIGQGVTSVLEWLEAHPLAKDEIKEKLNG